MCSIQKSAQFHSAPEHYPAASLHVPQSGYQKPHQREKTIMHPLPYLFLFSPTTEGSGACSFDRSRQSTHSQAGHQCTRRK